MKSFNLANLIAPDPDRPTLRERAAALKASAAKVMQRRRPGATEIPAIATSPAPTDASTSPILPASAALAEACDWAAKHVVWINGACHEEGWDDERCDAEIDKHTKIWDRALAEPAKSFSDLAAKARLFGEDWERHNPDDGSRDGLDMMVVSILRDVAALDAARPPLVDELLVAWREWTITDGTGDDPNEEAAWECRAQVRSRLIGKAEALPATAESVPAKAIALAWISYVDLWFKDRPREDYAIDGKLALDIHAAAQASLPAGSLQASVA